MLIFKRERTQANPNRLTRSIIQSMSDFPADCEPPEGWDDWCRDQGFRAGFCQSSVWARINSAANGADNYWVEIIHDDQRCGGALLSLTKPKLPRAPWVQRAKSILAGDTAGWFDCSQGPVLAGANKAEALTDILHQVDGLIEKTGARGVRFHGLPPTSDSVHNEDVLFAFRRFNYTRISFLTALVDLGPPEDQIFARFKHAARKGIRKCERNGVSVTQCESRDEFIRDFCLPYFERRDTDFNVNRSLAMWDIDGGAHYRFFVAKDPQGRVLATLGSYSFNGLATEIMSHRTEASFEANLPAQDLLHWHIFRTHKTAGDFWFDLAGYSPQPRTQKEVGIRRFKEKWGGREVSVPNFAKHNPTLAQRAWRGPRRRRRTDDSLLAR